MAFVENFRRFTKIPVPQKAPFEVRELLEHAMTLIAAEGIRIRLDVEPADTMIYADQMLVGQVVVNLLKNAREAVGTRRDACIEITSRIDPQENVVIEISNNRKYLYAFLHDQTRRIGHRPERLAPHHAAAQRLAAPDGQHGQPGDLHAPVRIDARNAPYSVPANFRVTESSGDSPAKTMPGRERHPTGTGQQYPTAAVAPRSSAHRGTHRGRNRCSRPGRSRW